MLLCLCLALAILCVRKKRRKPEESTKTENTATSDTTQKIATCTAAQSLPSHIVLQKDDSLKDNAKALAENKNLLNNEFKLVENYAKANVQKKTTVGNLEENKAHNRYTDIGKGGDE